MKITNEDVVHVAKLAKLNLTENEIGKFTQNLSDIVNFADKLNEIDVSNVSPTAGVLPLQNVFRKDEIIESLDREKVLQNAPEKNYGCFWVRNKVVE